MSRLQLCFHPDKNRNGGEAGAWWGLSKIPNHLFFVFLIEKLSATPKDRADETKCQAPPMLYCFFSTSVGGEPESHPTLAWGSAVDELGSFSWLRRNHDSSSVSFFPGGPENVRVCAINVGEGVSFLRTRAWVWTREVREEKASCRIRFSLAWCHDGNLVILHAYLCILGAGCVEYGETAIPNCWPERRQPFLHRYFDIASCHIHFQSLSYEIFHVWCSLALKNWRALESLEAAWRGIFPGL